VTALHGVCVCECVKDVCVLRKYVHPGAVVEWTAELPTACVCAARLTTTYYSTACQTVTVPSGVSVASCVGAGVGASRVL
jgi:hypothetical protein